MSEQAKPWIIGHRGACGEAPENTLESFILAIEQRADMIELDVQLTAGGELVVFHDWSVMTPSGELVLEEASVEDLAALRREEVRRGLEKDARFPSLEDVLAVVGDQCPLNVELKTRATDPSRFVAEISRIVEPDDRILVSSFDWRLLEELRAAAPWISLAPLAEDQAEGLFQVAGEIGSELVNCNAAMVSRAFVEKAKALGLDVVVYTVNSLAEARDLLGLGVAGFFTDYPGNLRAGLAHPNAPRG